MTIEVKDIPRPLTDKARLAKIGTLHQLILDCECGGWCDRCIENFTEIGEIAEVKP
jgi:hypothetical protein